MTNSWGDDMADMDREDRGNSPRPDLVAKVSHEIGDNTGAIDTNAAQPRPAPTDPHPMDLAVERDAPYESFLRESSRWFCVFANANIGYRVGPMKATEVGPIITKANELGVPVLVTIEDAGDVDWEFVTDLMGGAEALAKRKAEREAKIADVSGAEPSS